jgi:hypothetical protein
MKNFDPAQIAEIYCGSRELKQIFAEACDRSSLSSVESYLANAGFDRDTISGFTLVVEKTVNRYTTAIADDIGRWPEYTFDKHYFLGIHADGQPLADEALLKELEDSVRRELTLHKIETSPYGDNWQQAPTIRL